ncbi:hypothetical protein DWB98_13215 (plasmid) [Staphylococcus xylosus]|uniref:hypothetical protein n=1 Tax=Staphylococcus TaxID=1279 RepID=UPI00118BE15F|nr:hypothetical protein [Staphylococcus xylosus]MBM6639446.1 hypothetical protein [Staphylococcus xylosus]QDW90401.1 hypothetical protein DWB98_13215 [Staphylococcus xylosus]
MKKFLALTFLGILLVTLSACNKDNEDKLQGKWKADNAQAVSSVGNKLVFNKGKIESNGGNNALFNLKAYTFKDEDKTIVRLYEETPDDELYSKDDPAVYGVLKIKDKDHISIETTDDGTYKFKKDD